MQLNRKSRVFLLVLSALAGWFVGQLVFPRRAPLAPGVRAEAPTAAKMPIEESGQSPDQRLAAIARISSRPAQIAAVAGWSDLQDVDEIRSLLDRLEQAPESEAKAFAQVFLLKRWIEIDPAGILENPSAGLGRGGQRRLEQIVLLWCEEDPDAAVAALRRHSSSNMGVLSLALAQISADDPAHALRLLEEHHLVADQFYRPVFAALAAEDLENAAQLAAALTTIEDPQRIANSSERGRRAAALAAVASEWAREDGAGAIAWLRGLPDADGPAVRSVMNNLAGIWSQADPRGFLHNLELFPSPDSDDRFYAAQAAATWWLSDPAAAMDWIDTAVDDAGLAVQMRTAIVNMAANKDDLATAFEMLEELPASDGLPSVLATISAKAIVSDPDGTIDWLTAFEDPDSREAAARHAAFELAQLDPAACIEHFDALASMLTRPEGNHFGYQVWDELIPHLLSQGGGVATGWIDELPTALRADALKSLAKNWASSDPRAAAEYIASQTDSESQVRASQEVVRQWARYDPAGAADWAAGLAEGQNREFIFKNISSHWSAADPVASAEWISGLPDSSSRDAALVAFASNTAVSDPAASLRMANSITDPEKRGEAMAGTLAIWRRSDQGSARAALQGLGLPDEETAVLRVNSSL
ncbi:MAG: hypothetical protein ACR2RV_05505 [Verrucomicrobiales bacterium]